MVQMHNYSVNYILFYIYEYIILFYSNYTINLKVFHVLSSVE